METLTERIREQIAASQLMRDYLVLGFSTGCRLGSIPS